MSYVFCSLAHEAGLCFVCEQKTIKSCEFILWLELKQNNKFRIDLINKNFSKLERTLFHIILKTCTVTSDEPFADTVTETHLALQVITHSKKFKGPRIIYKPLNFNK